MNFFGVKQDSPAEKQLKSLLFDDGVHVLSSFELNQIASLTYGSSVCDEIFEILERIVAQPASFTPLCIQKALVITKHILVYGAETCVNSAYGIGKFIEALQDFNTVLMVHQKQGAFAVLQRIQGGGVDKGGPVREAAKEVHNLLSNIHELRRIRNSSADPNSLVPVGDDKALFVTDEVRHYILQKRIDEQRQIQIKSNLAKSAGGFGGGYNSTDGKSVVGAAHGIEEMIKMANRGKQKYTDDGNDGGTSEEDAILAELMAAAAAQKNEAMSRSVPAEPSQASAPEVDLLDFGAGTTGCAPQTNGSGNHDLLGIMDSTPSTQGSNASHHADLLGLATGPTNTLTPPSDTGDLLGTMPAAPAPAPLSAIDPFAEVTTKEETHSALPSIELSSAVNAMSDGLDSLKTSLGYTTTSLPSIEISSAVNSSNGNHDSSLGGITALVSAMSVGNGAAPTAKKSIMGSNEDRFSALDALASVSATMPSLGSDNKASAFGAVTALTVLSKNPEMQNAATGMVVSAVNGDTHPSPSYANSSLSVSGVLGGAFNYGNTSDDDNPFVMGGQAGSGLNPLAPPPSSAPPPPPPPSS